MFTGNDSMIRNRSPFNNHQFLLRKEIRDSWIRSKATGVNPQAEILPTNASQKDIYFESIFLKLMAKYTKSIDYQIQDLNYAFFYTDQNLNIIFQIGNKELLTALNLINFGIGTNMDESIVGTNAAALAKITQSPSNVAGVEHYMKVLQQYDSGAIPASLLSIGDSGYILFITPTCYDRSLSTQIYNLFINTFRLTSDLLQRDLELIINQEACEQDDKGIIIVDKQGKIINVNKWMQRHYSIGTKNIYGEKLGKILPELAEAVDKIKINANHECEHGQIELNLLQKKTFIEYRTVNKYGTYCGMILSIYDKKPIDNKGKDSNLNAYFRFEDIIGDNPDFIKLKDTAKSLAMSNSSVVIQGESGTGKELFAEAIHNASARHNYPFVSINCAAIPRELIASELFGYVEGAFTGAKKGGAPGKFELAHNGTLFLDEIGEMPLDMQAVLLRALEERTVTRLGGKKPIPVNVRIIAATNQDLHRLVSAKKFRLDLYYRLNVINLELIPLRERKDDIPLLINSFLKQFSSFIGNNVLDITPEAKQILMNYDWPGNIRELRNVIERIVSLNTSTKVTISDLPPEILSLEKTSINNIKQSIQCIEPYEVNLLKNYFKESNNTKLILELMKKHKNNKSQVAKELGISRATLYRKLKAIDNSLD